MLLPESAGLEEDDRVAGFDLHLGVLATRRMRLRAASFLALGCSHQRQGSTVG